MRTQYQLEGYFGIERLVRYKWAQDFADGGLVLDVGCGACNGPLLLSGVANKVIGIDISHEAVRYAHNMFPAPNTNYIIMNATFLAFPENGFDLVVSFEVIEHIADYRQYLREVRRVLRPEGTYLGSTPNREGDFDSGSPTHVVEVSANEYRTLLEEFFGGVQIFGQFRSQRVIGKRKTLRYVLRRLDILKLRRYFSKKVRDLVLDRVPVEEASERDFLIQSSDSHGAVTLLCKCC